MDTPRGFNPIGESAPGLPRHDAPLPGHVPGQFQNIGGADQPSQPTGGMSQAYNGPALPDWATKPFVRVFFFMWVYLTAPIQAALYPIAGIGGLVGAGVLYLLARMVGGGYDTTHGWAWTGCFLGVVALMRFETHYESVNPGYKKLRGWLRLALAFIGMFWFAVSSHGDGVGVAFITSAMLVVILFFVLRSKWLRFVWHALQHTSWMRASVESPLNP